MDEREATPGLVAAAVRQARADGFQPRDCWVVQVSGGVRAAITWRAGGQVQVALMYQLPADAEAIVFLEKRDEAPARARLAEVFEAMAESLRLG